MTFMGRPYAVRMRFVFSGLLLAFLASSAPTPSFPQNPPASETRVRDRYFSGKVMAIDETTLTVNRKVLGRNSATRTFQVSPETRFEGGRPKVRDQVTVRYVTGDDGDRAVHVILRRSPK